MLTAGGTRAAIPTMRYGAQFQLDSILLEVNRRSIEFCALRDLNLYFNFQKTFFANAFWPALVWLSFRLLKSKSLFPHP